MENNITIVSCYYKLDKSKHSHTKYLLWIKNMLQNIETPMVIFYDENDEIKQTLLSYRGEKPMYLINRPIEDFYVTNQDWDWDAEYKKDWKKKIHNTNLYKIWNEKPNFLYEASYINKYNSDYYIWCDIGCFRYSSNNDKSNINPILCKKWPKIDKIPHNKILITKVVDSFKNHIKTVDNNGKKLKIFENSTMTNDIIMNNNYIGISGSMFAGHKSTIKRYHDIYYKNLSKFFENNVFAGDDQNIIFNIHYENSEILSLLPYKNDGTDEWFYLHWYLL